MLVQLRTPRDLVPRVEPARRSVALVVMPVHLPSMPSLATATLSEGLRARGHHVEVFPFHVHAAVDLGLDAYELIGAEDAWVHNVSEWLFSHASITEGAASLERMRAHLAAAGAPKKLLELDFERLRTSCDRAIDRYAESLDWSRFDVVGFSVMFQQLNASLRLAARIKERSPTTRVVFGGSCMERPMGDAILRRYPWLDAVFGGYGDRTLPEYVEKLPPKSDTPIVDDGPFDLDELPLPSFDEYVRALADSGLSSRIRPHVLLETSRGCWYGEKQHCTFCGVNGTQMKFRQKSGERVFEEVRALSRYGLPLWATDNIMALGFFKDLFPRMQAEGVRFPAFYEVKSNLRREQLEMLASVGIDRLQPGIESLSTELLTLMKKGVTGVQNVWFLRACEELGISVQWNVLYGFPRENGAEYDRLAALVPALAHLQAPTGCGKIHLLRYSPNHKDAAALGFVNLRPSPSYALAFGAHPGLEEQAYVFEADYEDGRDPATYTRALDEACTRWQRIKGQILAPRCEVFELGGKRVLVDTRSRGRVGRALPSMHVLDDAEWTLLQALESPIARAKLERAWTRSEPLGPMLSRFAEAEWLLEADERLVRLVVVREERRPHRELARVVSIKAKALTARVRRRFPGRPSTR